MNNLQHIRSMAEMIIKQVDELEGKTEPTPYEIGKKMYRDGLGYSDIWSAVKCNADINEAADGYMDAMRDAKANLRKFAVGDTVYYLNCAGDEVEAIVVDVHQYDLDRYIVESCGLYKCWMTEKQLSSTPRSNAEPKFKVGDKVTWKSDFSEKVYTVVTVGLDQLTMDAHVAGRVTIPNKSGIYFKYDVVRPNGDSMTFGEAALEPYDEPKAGPKFKVGDRVKVRNTAYYKGGEKLGKVVRTGPFTQAVLLDCGDGFNFYEDDISKVEAEERIWYSHLPPHVGWWNVKPYNQLTTETFWSWWDGEKWSAFSAGSNTAIEAGWVAAGTLHDGQDTVKWCDYWPENARVPRINPGELE